MGEEAMELSAKTWRGINDYLVEIEESESEAELSRRALEGVLRFIPADIGAGLVDASQRLIAYPSETAGIAQVYNSRYWCIVPSLSRGADGAIRWSDRARWADYPNSEFYADFARPLGVGASMSVLRPPQWLSITLQRSSGGRSFSKLEHTILEVLNPHVRNLLSLRKKLDARPLMARVSAEELRFCFPALSPREAQTAALLCMGASAREIASALRFGLRTAESHVAHIYQKLDVLCRRDAVDTMRVALASLSGHALE